MNKKYMDFVPAKRAASTTSRQFSGQRKVSGSVSQANPSRPVLRQTVVRTETRRVVREAPEMVREEVLVEEDVVKTNADTFSIKNEPEYGVIEDFRPKFVHTEVEKRPLSRNYSRGARSDASKLQADHVEDLRAVDASAKSNATLKVPKSPFINHGKVAKRPLSKNVYEKKIEPTKEESKGPLTIIDQQNVDQKSGLVAAIILTIILGAVAGTIAFLLLPK